MDYLEYLVDENIFFSITSTYGIYLKIMLLVLLISIMVYRHIRYKTNVKIYYLKNLYFIFLFVIFYMVIDILQAQAIYNRLMFLGNDHDTINEKLHTDYDIRLTELSDRIDSNFGRIYDDYSIQHLKDTIKIDTLKNDNKRKFK